MTSLPHSPARGVRMPRTERRAQLLGAAREVFVANGFHAAAMDEIAERVALSPGTVRNYLSSAVQKLGASNRHEAVRTARRHGWI